MRMAEPEHFDVLVVGAGLSGVAAGYHLQDKCPGKSYVILESRDAIGGTWDLFRYPGIRSDSDMYTLGFNFRPWRNAKAIADGPSILEYVRDTARENGIDRKVRFHHRVTRAEWSSRNARWTVEAQHSDEILHFSCNFLFMCSGYYDYANGYKPEFPDAGSFAGKLIHPQHWPENLDYEGKRVVVIGSGATAVTLAPAMAEKAAHVMMLQRSPTYMVSRPSEDALANSLRQKLPPMLAYQLTRWKNVLLGMWFFRLARRKPEKVKAGIINLVSKQLGPDYDVGTHFTPRYNPWDQRLCLVPDGDLFREINAGRMSIVTDHVERFTLRGIKLKSGQELAADIIVTATGLQMKLFSGLNVSVDGAPTDLAKTMSYKGMMFSGVPNFAGAFGYTNASWTLKADLTCEYVCRLLRYMDRHGYRRCMPQRDPSVTEVPWLNFTSGYVQRAINQLPRQGSKKPWKLYQNYARDLMALRFGSVKDAAMQFSK
jgi:cation diffusion facilitator CzcD-associated flavoprotein CzcO